MAGTPPRRPRGRLDGLVACERPSSSARAACAPASPCGATAPSATRAATQRSRAGVEREPRARTHTSEISIARRRPALRNAVAECRRERGRTRTVRQELAGAVAPSPGPARKCVERRACARLGARRSPPRRARGAPGPRPRRARCCASSPGETARSVACRRRRRPSSSECRSWSATARDPPTGSGARCRPGSTARHPATAAVPRTLARRVETEPRGRDTGPSALPPGRRASR